MTKSSKTRVAKKLDDAPVDTVTITTEHLVLVRQHHAELRATTAELELAGIAFNNARAAKAHVEREGQALLDVLNKEFTADGKYELVSGIDLKTGEVKRRLRT